MIQNSGIIIGDNNDVSGFNTVQYNTAPTSIPTTEGTAFWDATDHTVSLRTDQTGVTLQVGQEMYVRARNSTGVTITNGSVVYVSGSTGLRPNITLAKADALSTSQGTIGMTTHDIANNTDGIVTIVGLVRDLNTSTFLDGDVLYLSATTSGAVTNVSPVSPNFIVEIGHVIKSHITQGVILVDITRPIVSTGVNTTVSGFNRLLSSADADVQKALDTLDNSALGASTTDTLSNKSISLGSNTLTGTSAELATAISDETGTGSLVFATSPTLVTPTLGAALGTSLALGGATLGTNVLSATGTAEIGGSISSKATTASFNVISTGNGASAYINFASNSINGAAIQYNQNVSGALEFMTGGVGAANSKLLIKSTGEVGIGTTSPNSLLNIGTGTPSTAASGIQFGSDTSANLYRSGSGIIKTDGWLYGSSGLIGTIVQFNNMYPLSNVDLVLQTRVTGSNNIIFKTTGTTPTETMRLDTNGNLGIGTTSPTAKLQVTQGTSGIGTVATNGTTTLTGTGTQFTNTFKVGDTITVSGETVRTIATIASDTSLTVTVAFSTTASGLTYTLTGGTLLSVFGNGNISTGGTISALGTGTHTFSGPVKVSTASDARFFADTTNALGAVGYYFNRNGSTVSSFALPASSSDTVFTMGATESYRITNTGAYLVVATRIGVGVTPSYPLHVVGDTLLNGGVGIGALPSTAIGQLRVQSGAAGRVAAFIEQPISSATTPVVVVKGGATPGVGGDLQQWQNSAGTALAKIDSAGNISATNLSGTNTGDQNIFSTIAVSGQSNVVADTTSDTLTLVAGTNVTITTDAATDTITINSTSSGGGITWTEVTGTTQSAAINNGYLTNNAGLVTVTLPSTAAVGSIVEVAGSGAGGWKIAQNASGQIKFGNQATTLGIGGYLASVNQYDAVRLICITANNIWSVISSQGNITVV